MNRRCGPRGARLLAAALALAALVAPAAAQNGRWLPPEDLKPIQRSYGLEDDEFMIGAYTANTPPSGLHTDMWRFLDTMGVSVWHSTAESQAALDSMVDGRVNAAQRLIVKYDSTYLAGFGREVQFYPFDSVQSEYWQSKFASLNGGTVDRSLHIQQLGLREVFYDATNTTAGQTIAKWISYDWKSGQVNRYLYDPTTGTDVAEATVQSAHQFIEDGGRETGARSRDYYVAVTGHMFNDSASNALADTARLLEIDVVYEIPRNAVYRNALGATVTAAANLEILDTMLVVRRQDLAPNETPPRYDRYREVSFPIDLTRCMTGESGPLVGGENPSRRFDLRVRWTGAGKVAVRSIAVRDWRAQLLMAQNDTAEAYRAMLTTELRRMVYGADTAAETRRAAVIRVDADHEPGPTEYGAFEYLNRMIKREFHVDRSPDPGQPGDSLPAHCVQYGGAVRHRLNHFHAVTTPDEVNVEIGYISDLRDTVKLHPNDGTPEGFRDMADYGISLHKLPAISEHNGDRYHLPELQLTPQGVALYEDVLQNLHFGRNISNQEIGSTRYALQNGATFALGRTAALARDNGRRLIAIPGLVGQFRQRVVIDDTNSPPATHLDRIVSHTPEASEYRLAANLALCYGARGVLSYWIGSYPHDFTADTVGGTHYWVGGMESFGPTGYLTTDRFVDRIDYTLREKTTRDSIGVLADFYVGWKNRSTELAWINKDRLARLGAEMAQRGLRWRDGYSVHFQTLRPGVGIDVGLTPRPLPQDEIVTEVKSYALGSTVADSAHKTFVELGFFYTHPDTSARRLDTNYVFVVNRRAFERPADISPTSGRGRTMDTLAESRRITLQLNLTRQTNRQYEFVRVREVHPDTVRLPLTNGPRQPIDTTVPFDALVELNLRAGAGTLLELTYVPPDESIVNGRIEFNSQRKLVYHGQTGRYYSVYFKDTSLFNPAVPLTQNPHRDTYIFLRRSVPVDTTGVILWEPVEYCLSIQGQDSTRFWNLHPSLTLRTAADTVVATVVWTCHPPSGPSGDSTYREVVLRNTFFTNAPTPSMTTIENVAMYYTATTGVPADSTAPFGVPVVCRTDSAYIVAWADATQGVMARLRTRPPGSLWAPFAGLYSATVRVYPVVSSLLGPGALPSVPTFSHIASNSRSCGLAWQQPVVNRDSTIICYARLIHGAPGLGGVPTLAYANLLQGSPTSLKVYRHPSIDQTQDIWGRIQDVVVYQGAAIANATWALSRYRWLQARSFYTDPSGVSWGWGENIYLVGMETPPGAPARIYPNVASTNDLTSSGDVGNAFFSVVYHDPVTGKMFQRKYRYTESFHPTVGGEYDFGGTFPNAAASAWRQVDRHGVLYQGTTAASNPALRTTRQFFARTRPGAYIASGREVSFSVDDSTMSGFQFWLHDPWVAGDDESRGVALVARDSTYLFTNTLGQVHQLLRTTHFHADDTTRIGLRLLGWAMGDSATLGAACVSMIAELVDSATGTVAMTLDSAALRWWAPDHAVEIDTTVDLLSGTYFIRLRLDTAAVTPETPINDSRYRVTEIAEDIDAIVGKIRRVDRRAGAQARIDARPNPFESTTTLRFSVPRAGYAAVRVYDRLGRSVDEPLPRRWTEPGRYEVDVNAGDLPNGTYIVELTIDRERVVEKMILFR